MANIPDPAMFSVNERDGEYYARFTVEGEIVIRIKASDLESAKAQAKQLLDGDDGDDKFLELDDVNDVRLQYVGKELKMYRVTREGRSMQVARLEPGDLPREPDERGF